MRMIHNYQDFCSFNDLGQIKPDVNSELGHRSVQCLKKAGWKIGTRTKIKDLLSKCRESEENFKMAYQHCGIDFWVITGKYT